MDEAEMVVATTAMVLGLVLVVVAVFRALGNKWTYGWYELWVLPVTGFALIGLGLWLLP
jgi:hypothetical protein